jgi:hypothetical protein
MRLMWNAAGDRIFAVRARRTVRTKTIGGGEMRCDHMG